LWGFGRGVTATRLALGFARCEIWRVHKTLSAVRTLGRVVALLVGVAILGCGSTGPKDYPFEGVWVASGGEMNGDTLDVTQSGDTVSGTFLGGGVTGSISGTNASGEVEFVTVVASGDGSEVLPLYTGHFVSAGTVEGRLADGSSATVTLTRATALVVGLD
jgi:hypothetical protein